MVAAVVGVEETRSAVVTEVTIVVAVVASVANLVALVVVEIVEDEVVVAAVAVGTAVQEDWTSATKRPSRLWDKLQHQKLLHPHVQNFPISI